MERPPSGKVPAGQVDPPFRTVNWKIVAGLALAAIIAWLAPFDLAFGAATLGSPALRAAAIVALALTGLAAGRRIELGVEPRGLKRPILTPIAIAAIVAAACFASDWLMRPALHSSYLKTAISMPLAARTILYALRAFNENILYLLFFGSVLIWLIGRVWRQPDGRPAVGAYVAGFTLAQVLNIWINATSLAPLTPIALLHDTIRYVAPGLVWAWLYWRHGFQSNEIACTSVHLFLQPMMVFLSS